MRLIDADAFAEVVEKIKVTMQGHDVVKRTAKLCMLSYIDSAPTIDAAPVIHGKYIYMPKCGAERCSICGIEFDDCLFVSHCQSCGAKMDLEV